MRGVRDTTRLTPRLTFAQLMFTPWSMAWFTMSSWPFLAACMKSSSEILMVDGCNLELISTNCNDNDKEVIGPAVHRIGCLVRC